MKTKKLLAILLAIIMTISVLPLSVWAEELSEQPSNVPEATPIITEIIGPSGTPTEAPEGSADSTPGATEEKPEETPAPSAPEGTPEGTETPAAPEGEPEGTETQTPDVPGDETEGENSEQPSDEINQDILGDVSHMSLLPLETYYDDVLIAPLNNPNEELLAISPCAVYVRDVLAEAFYNTGVIPSVDADYDGVILYCCDDDENYTPVTLDDIIIPDSVYTIFTTMRFIVGDGDQLNPDNKRYKISVSYSRFNYSFCENMSLAVFNPDGEEIKTVKTTNVYDANYSDGKAFCAIWCKYDSIKAIPDLTGYKFLVKLNDNDDVSNIEAYAGINFSESQIADKENIASKILYDGENKEPFEFEPEYSWTNYTSSKYDVTFVITYADGTRQFIPIILTYVLTDNSISVYTETNTDVERANRRIRLDNEYYYSTYENVYNTSDFNDLNATVSAVHFDYTDVNNDGDGIYSPENIEYACFGLYNTMEDAIADGREDIKDALFSESGMAIDLDEFETKTAYLDDDTEIKVKTIYVTAFDKYGFCCPAMGLYAISDGIIVEDPSTGSTYFEIEGTYGETENKYLSNYIVNSDDDSYYRNGYQTMFILDDGQPYAGETIIPIFDNDEGTKVHMDSRYAADGGSSDVQNSGKSKILFKDGEAIQYTVTTESGTALKNYWVTFATRHTGGSKLFVNATNNPSHYKDGKPSREVFFNDNYGIIHDILIANLGDQPLTGIDVELKDAKGIMLDTYWTVPDTGKKSLAAFTTTNSPYRDENGNYLEGELYNLAKIRLLPSPVYNDVYGGLYNESGDALYEMVQDFSYFGEISGTLTISADGNEPVEIVLTGIAGTPKIVTDQLLEGVKYVPYSCMIQTNSMYDTGAMQFTVVGGALPSGIELMANGELYGIPKQAGEFEFTVEAKYVGNVPGDNVDTSSFVDYHTYTLIVKDNTDENVDAVNTDEKQGYLLEERISKYVTIYYTSMNGDYPVIERIQVDNNQDIFLSEGSYSTEFLDFYLDGVKLEEGTDYKAEEGSTRITISAQTFSHLAISDPDVAHTFAAEFRNQNQELKKSAQNVYLRYQQYVPYYPQNPGSSDSDSDDTTNFETVTATITFVDKDGNGIKGLSLELHSDVKYATTDKDGKATFEGVEFGRHTLFVTNHETNTVISKTFTIVSGFDTGITDNIIVAQVGESIDMTMEYDGNNLSLLSAIVDLPVDVPQEGADDYEDEEVYSSFCTSYVNQPDSTLSSKSQPQYELKVL